MPADIHWLRVAYIVIFSLSAIGCFGGIVRARNRIEDPDTRWGLVTLLATSGLWAAFLVGRLAVPQSVLKITFYVLGLIVGLASVGAWLYFCSAYSGEDFHQQPAYRRLAVAVFVFIVGVKVTSPIHGLYFDTSSAAIPFPHLVIRLGILHWVVTGMAYALSAVGFYLLFDMFRESSYATRKLGILVGLAGLPVVPDILGYTLPESIVTLNYEPIGVAVFALGVLYVADGSFLAVRRFGREQLVDEIDEGIVLVDPEGTIRDVNAAAERVFPELADSVGKPISAVEPSLESYLSDGESRVLTLDETDPPSHYLLSTQRLTAGQTPIGDALVITDVSEVERQRRDIEYQHAQMDAFADAITHELRNTLTIVEGHLDLAGSGLDPDADPAVTESLAAAGRATDRMADIVSDLATLAQHGQRVEQTEPLDVERVALRGWEVVADDSHQLRIDGTGEIQADKPRLERLFENLFRFELDNGATTVELRQVDGQLVVTDDGHPLTEEAARNAFTYGEAVPDAESGMVLPIVRTLAEAHGWTARFDTTYEDGVRIVISL